MMKRALDVAISALGIILLSPLFLLIAVLIKMDSHGPILYLQERVGKKGRLFKLFKFRTMLVYADKSAAITIGKRDPRITLAGYFLRRHKLDELPQLLNVLFNDMSLVGPRPELKKFVDLYDDHQRKVISVKPGITDLASIMFRNENELLEGKPDPIGYYVREIMPEKLNLNLQYIRDQSLWLDLRIIFRTVFSIFSSK